jgi:putative membrane protein
VGLTRILIGAVALIAAALIVPGIEVDWGDETIRTAIVVGVLAILFGVINAYLRPILRVLSLPANLLSMGLASFALNAVLLILLAWLVDAVWEPVLHLGSFPPTVDAETLTAAVAGSLIVSVVTTIMSVLLPNA